MPPVSSLVFVVILAVWAVYLVQHWVRRRDHLATARSVDRFSEAMRVLERRRALPVPEADAPPRSYAASPLRPARPGPPEVVVKHRHGGVAHGATAVAPSLGHRRARRAARLRASGLLLGSLTMVTLVGLAMAGVLPRWYALAGVAVCAVAFTLVRWSVARQRAARRVPARRTTPGARRTPAARVSATGRTAPVAGRAGATATGGRTSGRLHHPAADRQRHAAERRHPSPERQRPATERQRPAAERRPADAGHPTTDDGHAFSAQSVAVTLRTTSRREAVRGAASVDQAAGPELYDVYAVEASLAEPVTVATGSAPAFPATDDVATAGTTPAEPDARPADGTWDPVPVPPPTYTLKAKAYRGVPAGSASLPADGIEMALEEEFEDLPRIDRVG